MKNAPWDADDREVLREKWRLASETASWCERLLHEVEILRIPVNNVAEQTPEHDELAVDARNMFIAVGQKLFESGLTMADWKWFVENRIPDEPDQWQKLGEHCQQAEKLNDLFRCLEEFVRAIAKAKRTFADSIRLSLNAWEEADNPNTSWFQRADNGVRLHGTLVEVRGRNADVLFFLCQRTSRPSTYEDLARLSETWQDGLDVADDDVTKSTQSNIRTCINEINKALRKSFNLEPKQNLVKLVGQKRGWKLNKDLLQEYSQ